MRVLKAFLSFVLIICAFWFFLVVFGSSVLKKVVQVYLGEYVQLHNVQVSPKLNVMIERVDFRFPTSVFSNEVSGSSRAVSFKFHALFAKPLVAVKLGPTKLSTSSSFDEISLSLSPINLLNWDDSAIAIEGEHLQVDEIIDVEDFNLTGIVSFDLEKIYDIDLEVKNIHLFNGKYFNTDLARATVDQVYFKLHLEQQFNDLEIFSELIEADFEQVSATKVNAIIKNREGKVEADLFLGAVNGANYNITGDQLHAHTNFLYADNALNEPITLHVKKVYSSEHGWVFSDAYGRISTDGTGGELDLNASINELELKNGKQYFGKIEDGFVELKAKFSKWSSGLSGDFFGALTVGSSSNFLAQISAQAAIDDESNLLHCVEKKCEFSRLSANYFVRAGDDNLDGLLECPNGNCFSESTSHKVTTSNTEIFFNKLMQVGILSPLLVSFLYYEVRKGIPIEDGHQFYLN